MRYLLFLVLALTAASASAETTVVRSRTVIRSAQEDATEMARTGRLAHRGGVGCEGVGFSTRSAADAKMRCCYWNQRPLREVAVVRGARGWFACARYW